MEATTVGYTMAILLASIFAVTLPDPVLGQNSVADLVTVDFFKEIKSHATGTCPGLGFYHHSSFIQALNSFPGFGKRDPYHVYKHEIAAFFAHVTHETGHMCHIREQGAASTPYCQPNTEYPCVPGQYYYGRGPLQITGNYNYGPAGRRIGVDLLHTPDRVAQDPVISFQTALWFWMNNVRPVMNQGFGATIRAINGDQECGGKQSDKVDSRIRYYQEYCSKFGILPGNNLRC